jgi:hypothetical protein
LDPPLSNFLSRERFLPWAFAIGYVQSLDLENCWIFRLRQDKICTTSHTGTSASAPLAAGVCALALGMAATNYLYMLPKRRSLRTCAKYSGYIHITLTSAPSGPSLPKALGTANTDYRRQGPQGPNGLVCALALVISHCDWT